MQTHVFYDLGNYAIGMKDPMVELEKNTEEKMRKLREQFAAHGMLHSVDLVMIVGSRGHPHVLTMQSGSSFFKLPGGEMLPGESSLDGVHRILDRLFSTEGVAGPWRPTELLSEWYRPNFDANIVCRSFEVPRNFKLVAVPMFEVFDNKECYGIVISSLPQLLSRLRMTLGSGAEGEAERAPALLDH